MSNVKIESDLKDFLSKIDSKIDKLDDKLSQKIDKLDNELSQKIDKLDDKFSQKLDKLSEDTTNLKVGQQKIEGKFDAFEEKVKGIDARVNNQEFLNRAVVIGLLVALLSGAAKMFGIIGNS